MKGFAKEGGKGRENKSRVDGGANLYDCYVVAGERGQGGKTRKGASRKGGTSILEKRGC